MLYYYYVIKIVRWSLWIYIMVYINEKILKTNLTYIVKAEFLFYRILGRTIHHIYVVSISKPSVVNRKHFVLIMLIFLWPLFCQFVIFVIADFHEQRSPMKLYSLFEKTSTETFKMLLQKLCCRENSSFIIIFLY